MFPRDAVDVGLMITTTGFAALPILPALLLFTPVGKRTGLPGVEVIPLTSTVYCWFGAPPSYVYAAGNASSAAKGGSYTGASEFWDAPLTPPSVPLPVRTCLLPVKATDAVVDESMVTPEIVPVPAASTP